MFIVQLQIIPDKMLLGNRDTFADNKKEKVREKTTIVDRTCSYFIHYPQ